MHRRNLADTTVELYVQDMIGALPQLNACGRPGDRQPAVHPIRGFRVSRAGGARP